MKATQSGTFKLVDMLMSNESMTDLPFDRSKILKLARRTATKLMFSSKRLVLSTTGNGQISLVFMTSRASSCTVRLGMKSMTIRYVQAQLRE